MTHLPGLSSKTTLAAVEFDGEYFQIDFPTVGLDSGALIAFFFCVEYIAAARIATDVRLATDFDSSLAFWRGDIAITPI
ncbi:MAG: hypothetical protein AAF589_03340 [Planctomycetota bacterium]